MATLATTESLQPKPTWWRRAAPGLALIVLAPLIGEVLPGATRMS